LRQIEASLVMADGGRPYANEPVIVGERGPEVFVPDQPGTVIPFGAPPMAEQPPLMQPYSDEQRKRAQMEAAIARIEGENAARAAAAYGPFDYVLGSNKLNPTAFDAWLANAPESENIEDLRHLSGSETDEYFERKRAAREASDKAAREHNERIKQIARAEREYNESAKPKAKGKREYNAR
jgi:hypothetical protein